LGAVILLLKEQLRIQVFFLEPFVVVVVVFFQFFTGLPGLLPPLSGSCRVSSGLLLVLIVVVASFFLI
jgi:hypothetical protein